MPKIQVVPAGPPDKTGGGWLDIDDEMERAIDDLLFIQNSRKMFINEKKQLQSLIYKLLELGYYKNNKTVIDTIGVF